MAEPSTVAQFQQKPLPHYQAAIKGMVANVRQQPISGTKYFLTLIRLPAADEYSHPATVEVRSEKLIGKKGEEIEGAVMVGGYPDSWERIDRDTGEKEVIPTARIVLQWIED
jgi:hypothetical protein